jgi:hypothetical protein
MAMTTPAQMSGVNTMSTPAQNMLSESGSSS